MLFSVGSSTKGSVVPCVFFSENRWWSPHVCLRTKLPQPACFRKFSFVAFPTEKTFFPTANRSNLRKTLTARTRNVVRPVLPAPGHLFQKRFPFADPCVNGINLCPLSTEPWGPLPVCRAPGYVFSPKREKNFTPLNSGKELPAPLFLSRNVS